MVVTLEYIAINVGVQTVASAQARGAHAAFHPLDDRARHHHAAVPHRQRDRSRSLWFWLCATTSASSTSVIDSVGLRTRCRSSATRCSTCRRSRWLTLASHRLHRAAAVRGTPGPIPRDVLRGGRGRWRGPVAGVPQRHLPLLRPVLAFVLVVTRRSGRSRFSTRSRSPRAASPASPEVRGTRAACSTSTSSSRPSVQHPRLRGRPLGRADRPPGVRRRHPAAPAACGRVRPRLRGARDVRHDLTHSPGTVGPVAERPGGRTRAASRRERNWGRSPPGRSSSCCAS